MDHPVPIAGFYVIRFTHVDLEDWLNRREFYKVEPPAFVGKKRTLTKEQHVEFSKALAEARAKHTGLVDRLMVHARAFFVIVYHGLENGWTRKRPLFVPLSELGAWLDDAFRDTPDLRPVLDLDRVAQEIATERRAHLQKNLEELNAKRSALEAELEHVEPIKQQKRARHE
jgi:hypothetical protein